MATLVALLPNLTGVPVWLALLSTLALLAVLLLVGGLGYAVIRRADRADLPQVLVSLSHVISSLAGLLPWGQPSALPAPAEPAVTPATPPSAGVQAVVLVRRQPVLQPGDSGGDGR